MISLPIISIVCCFAFVIFILFKYGVPVSLSETYYLLPVKWDWLFAAWTVLTTVPFAIYWFNVAPANLKWIPVTVAIAMLMIGVADCYKSGPKQITISNKSDEKSLEQAVESYKKSLKELLKELLKKFNPKEFFKYGPARFIHYFNSLLTIILSTIYICMTAGTQAIISTIVSYIMFIMIGTKVNGVYNANYSADVDNKAWIFFMEMICLINIFVFVI